MSENQCGILGTRGTRGTRGTHGISGILLKKTQKNVPTMNWKRLILLLQFERNNNQLVENRARGDALCACDHSDQMGVYKFSCSCTCNMCQCMKAMSHNN